MKVLVRWHQRPRWVVCLTVCACPTYTEDAAYGLDDACTQLYKLHSFEVLWEKAEDTKALLAWSTERIVLSFRGTASWANVLADLQFWLKGGYPAFLVADQAHDADLL